MNIGVAIVTYGDQSHFNGIRKSLRALEKISQIKEVVVIQNGSEYDLQNDLFNLNSTLNIKLVVNEINTGSAGGFSQGLRFFAYNNSVDYILLLDDDTRVVADAFDNIEKFEHKHDLTDKHIWSLFRKERYGNENFEKSWDYNLNYFHNRFISFSIMQFIGEKKMSTIRKNKQLSDLLYAPYAGMLVTKEAIQEVGFPNEKYYLYVDDIDYSLKIKTNGYKIYQIAGARLEDMSSSWSANTKHSATSFFEKNMNPGRYLYNARNWVYLIKSNNMVTNTMVYFINKSLYKIIMFLIFMPKTKWGLSRYRKLLKALSDGEIGKLGYDESYEI